jgi:hypothetical protein
VLFASPEKPKLVFIPLGLPKTIQADLLFFADCLSRIRVAAEAISSRAIAAGSGIGVSKCVFSTRFGAGQCFEALLLLIFSLKALSI